MGIVLEFLKFPMRKKRGDTNNIYATDVCSSGECSNFFTLSCSQSFVRGTHPHTSACPRNCLHDYFKLTGWGLTQKHKVNFFLELGIMKTKASFVVRSERKLPVTKINTVTVNAYIHYWRVLHSVRVYDSTYRFFPDVINALSNKFPCIAYSKKQTFFFIYGNQYILETNGLNSPRLEILKSLCFKY